MPSFNASRPQHPVRWLFASALMLLVSCLSGDGRSPTEIGVSGAPPALAISDAVHSGGTSGFYFLPPMVPQPTVSGTFDDDIATLNPRVVICDVTDGLVIDCGGATPALRTYTSSSTPAIEIAGDKYKVHWDTKEDGFVAGHTYRLYVQGGVEPNRRDLGFADILLTTVPGKAKSLANGDVIVLNDGRTLPIHFRVEHGVVAPPGDAHSFELTAATSTVAGDPASVTLTARDVNGLVATNYRGAVAFESSDPQATLPETYIFTEEDAGSHVFEGVILRKAGAITVRASDALVPEIAGEASVAVQPAGVAKLRLTGPASPVSAGVAHDVTVTALDAFDNTATGYRGTVQLTSSDAAASLPAAHEFTETDAGVHTFAGVTLKTAGTQSVDATDGSTPPLTATLSLTVQAATAAELRFTTQPSDVLAGESIMPPVVVTAYDVFANVATSFTGAVSVAFAANPGGATLSGTLTHAAAAGVATFADLRVSAAGTGYTLTASAEGLTGATSGSFDVIAPTPVEAHWINPAGGLWSVATNWSTGAVPTADQAALIDLPGTYTVTLDLNATVNGITLGASSGIQTLTMNSRTFTLLSPSTVLGTGRLSLNNSSVGGSGTLALASGAVLNLIGTSAVNAPLTNTGTVIVFNSATLNGAVTTASGSTIRLTSSGFGGAALTVASGFTNNGLIELTGTTNNGDRLTVNGTLVNAEGGTISVLPNGGGGRTITAPIDNRGTFSVGAALELNRDGASYSNSGVMTVTGGNVIMALNGASNFTNAGRLTIAAGRTLSVNGSAPNIGSFTHAAGATLDGGGALSLSSIRPAVFEAAISIGSLNVGSNSLVTLGTDISTATTALGVNAAIIDGPGTITNAEGRTTTITASTINAPVVNAGTLVAIGASTLTATVTTTGTSTIRVNSVGFGGSALTVSNGFTNNGLVELTGTSSNGVTLSASGTIVNSPTGTISVLQAAGGTRTITAPIDNQGAMSVGAALLLNRGSTAYSNSGLLAVNGGNLTVNLSGARTFTNSGTVTVATGRTLVFGGFAPSGGAVSNASGGTIAGDGAMQIGTSVPLSNEGSVSIGLVRLSSALTSSGSFAPVTTEFVTPTTIPVGAGYSWNNVRVAGVAAFAGAISLTGDLSVTGGGNLTIGAHVISVAGNFSTANTAVLTMQNAGGALEVSGNASFGGGSTNGRLTAGTLRVGGTFIQAGNAAAFAATTNHVTELNGSAAQSVSFTNPGATTTTSHFQRLAINNASAAGVTLASEVIALGQLRTPAGPLTARTISSTGQSLVVVGLDAAGLVFDGAPLRVGNGEAIARFDDVVFRNMDPATTQFLLDRRDGAVTFNNIQFLTTPTSGVYLRLIDTDLLAPMFTVTMQGTQPTNHGGRVIESMPGQLIGWPF